MPFSARNDDDSFGVKKELDVGDGVEEVEGDDDVDVDEDEGVGVL